MGALVALMLAEPLVDRSPHIGGLLALLQFLLLFVGASYITAPKMIRWFGLPVGCIWLAARFLEAFGNSRYSYTHFAPIAGLILSCIVLWVLLSRFGSISDVTGSVISEAFITYLVIAIAFSQLYWVLNHVVSNSFDRSISAAHSNTFLYFSMITLSGLGYSNIYPINASVRLVAAFENMIGVFYIAVIVSRLVSSYRARADRRDDRREAKINQMISAAWLVYKSTSDESDCPLKIQITSNQIKIHLDQVGPVNTRSMDALHSQVSLKRL